MTFRGILTKKLKTVLLFCLCAALLTGGIYYFRANYVSRNENRLILMLYQTTVTGSEAAEWAKKAESALPSCGKIQASAYLEQETPGSPMDLYSASLWTQILTRLASGEGDLLLLDTASFSALRENGFLLPLSGQWGDRAEKNSAGEVIGVRITGCTAPGLLYLEGTEHLGEEKPIESVKRNEQVYACIYKNAKNASSAEALLSYAFGGSHE